MATSTPSTDPMPQWIDDSRIDPVWFNSKTQFSFVTITARDISTNRGRQSAVPRHGGTLLLTCEGGKDGDRTVLVMKQIVGESLLRLSQQLGLAREALFYRDLRPKQCALPQIHYSYGNMETGEKCIIMESLSSDEDWIEAGCLFGPTDTFPSNPHNWSRNLSAIVGTKFGPGAVPTPADVTHACFVAVARIHATFWGDQSLLQNKPWLRGVAWHQGHGKESWESSQSLVRSIWEKVGSVQDTENPTIQWNERVKTAVVHCIQGISWDRRPQHRYITLVHGDFWPGNILWKTVQSCRDDATDDPTTALKLIDWEMVGVGSGPQDLGQFVISNLNPVDRRACEKELVRAYYDALVSNGVQGNDEHDLWNFCWEEYRIGGVERWLWFLVWFLGQEGIEVAVKQFFHDQILSFMQDHDLTAESLTQPRP